MITCRYFAVASIFYISLFQTLPTRRNVYQNRKRLGHVEKSGLGLVTRLVNLALKLGGNKV